MGPEGAVGLRRRVTVQHNVIVGMRPIHGRREGKD